MHAVTLKKLLFLFFLKNCIIDVLANPASSKNSNIQSSSYKLKDEYNASNFFDNFDFFTAPDPSNGAVLYESKQNALNSGLASTKAASIPGPNGQRQDVVHLAAYSGKLSKAYTGRPSVRLTSQRKYNKGLFIGDFSHLPVAECGVWPAFWTSSIPTWPQGGEIDIIESVNLQANNEIVLHTGGKCSMTADNDQMTGLQGSADCGNADGCTVKDRSTDSYGVGFNKGKGGVYAMEWTAKSVKVWWWPRNKIPSDVSAGKPNPQSWQTPVASFSGKGCDFDKLFSDHEIVFDITFCGDWAGKQTIWDQQCSANNGPSCASHVLGSQDGFKEAYWDILSVKVYQNN